jgi:translocation and assembly module TamA
LLALLSTLLSPARSQDFSYTVEIDAPARYAKLLRDNLEIVKWQDNPRMTIEQLQRLYRDAPREIQTLLATQGYFSAKVESSLARSDGKWIARFQVDPGEPSRVSQADLEFTGAIASTEADRISRLRAQWALPVGSVFDQQSWEDAKRELLKDLLIRDYPAARIAESEARVNPQTREVAIRISVDSGPPFTFGELDISGLKRYSSSVVEKLNPIEPGSPYNQEELVTFQSRLQDTGYFASAFVTAEADPTRADRVPVKVAVTENRTQKVSFGVGFSTNTGARVQVDYQHLDFLDRGWRFATGLKLEQKRQGAQAEVALPLTDKDYRYSFGAKFEQTDIENEETSKLSLGATRSRKRGNIDTALSLNYLTEDQEVENVLTERNRALFLNYAWTVRNIDDLLDPRQGYVFNWQLGGGSKSVLSEQDFVRAYGKAAAFFPVATRDTLIFRGELGWVFSDTRIGIPTDLLWRTGGDNSIRGYSYQSIGVERGDAVVGGRYLVVGSAEYLHRFTDKWGAAVFYDVGDATDNTNDFDPVQGVGLGVRYRSPVGPIGADLAYGIDEQQFRLHFAIGFAF